MPIYQMWCEKCMEPYEVLMNLGELDEYDTGRLVIKCPVCGENMRKLICPPRIIHIN